MGAFLVGATGTGNSFAASAPDLQSQDFTGKLGSTEGGLNGVISMLQGEANGTGPNMTQEALRQNSEQAIKANAGYVASQKGISPALAARMAAQNAAGMQQQAAGEGAQMGMQERLGAQGALGNVLGGQESTLQNALGAYNNAQVGATSNMNNVNASVAGQNAATAKSAAGGLLNGAMSAFAEGGEVKPPVQHLDAGGSVMSNWGYGMHPIMDAGGAGAANSYIQQGEAAKNPYSGLSAGIMNYLKGPKEIQTDDEAQEGYLDAGAELGHGNEINLPATGATSDVGGGWGGAGAAAGAEDSSALGDIAAFAAARGGQVPQMMADGGDPDGGMMGSISKLIPLALMALKDGGKIPDHLHHVANLYDSGFGKSLTYLKSKGGKVPGDAPKPKENSYSNDKVPALLSSGEVVIDHETLNNKGPVGKAARMVAKSIAERNEKGSGNHASDFHDALRSAIGNRRGK